MRAIKHWYRLAIVALLVIIAVPAAIANAVEDAVYAAGRPVEVDMVPVTPLRLWKLLSKGR